MGTAVSRVVRICRYRLRLREIFQASYAAPMRRVLVPHRLAIPIPVRAASPSARSVEWEGRREPVSELLEALADAPGDNSARYCGGVRWRGRRFGVVRFRENEKKEESKGGVLRRDGRAILVLCARPNLAYKVLATTNTRPASSGNGSLSGFDTHEFILILLSMSMSNSEL